MPAGAFGRKQRTLWCTKACQQGPLAGSSAPCGALRGWGRGGVSGCCMVPFVHALLAMSVSPGWCERQCGGAQLCIHGGRVCRTVAQTDSKICMTFVRLEVVLRYGAVSMCTVLAGHLESCGLFPLHIYCLTSSIGGSFDLCGCVLCRVRLCSVSSAVSLSKRGSKDGARCENRTMHHACAVSSRSCLRADMRPPWCASHLVPTGWLAKQADVSRRGFVPAYCTVRMTCF
jgi:hypothetical protein